MSTYYDVLGLSKEATSEEIKKAYRSLAMVHHPDRNHGDPDAEAKFKKINEAYDVLKDETKRAEYDDSLNPRSNGAWTNHFAATNIDDFIAQMFQQHGFGQFGRVRDRNRDISLTVNLSLEDAYRGRQIPLKISTPSGRQVDIIVTIPSGVDNGTKIRYQGQGDHTNTSLPPGDLYILVSISEHPIFTRKGSSLETGLMIDAISAIIGTKSRVACIDGQEIELVIPPGTQPGTKMRISGKGMPVQANSTSRGDMIVAISISTPIGLDEQMMATLRNIQNQRGLDIT